jgi:hypothetical protein
MTFEKLATEWTWQPIRNCPGRFVLSLDREDTTAPAGVAPVPALSPQDLAGAETVFWTHVVPTARDPVVVGRLDQGGLISYQRRDGTYVHTLNTQAGFERKLRQLGIMLPPT